ncbi:amidohydrolase [Modestobacter sp. VKM Ac-2979]|uniref:amidohydrolase n=1 Tax=unclassified Modestobacter TaxID=2643866 RepID=UPI0022ABBA64|nr:MULTISPECIES: amidohydrolase [unclassified Modestobacter]MCZ2814257.1 amidohydrolase [Modestobacter sp. VKM Ac-2979]MCZ2844051.1 amidohydrolase [Modestobacter sp. VKM Ac-2980]
MSDLDPDLAGLPLVDHHCHGLVRRDLTRAGFESMLTEAAGPSALGGSLFDSQVGLAVRRWCPPVLDLPAHAPAEEYLDRRAELGADEVNRRMLAATGTGTFLVDTGYLPEPITSPAELAALAGGRAREIVRLEALAEEVLADGGAAADFPERLRTRLAARTAEAAGVKSIAAYRVGLALEGTRPDDAEVARAADRLLAGGGPVRIADPVLHRFLIWSGIDLGMPVQFHVGYGDADVDLHRCDPLLLTDLLRATEPAGVPVMLLHNYPFHRHAGFLAQVFGHVFVDVGLATHNVGHRSGALLRELLELAPFGKVLFSSDAFGLAELYLLGTLLFRRGLGRYLAEGVAEDAWTTADAVRIAGLIGAGNAERAYRLG